MHALALMLKVDAHEDDCGCGQPHAAPVAAPVAVPAAPVTATGGAARIDIDAVVPYLMEKGLLSPAQVVAGVQVHELTRRNRNFRILRSDRTGLIVKQPANFEESHLVRAVINEAELLASLGFDDVLAPMAAHAPRLLYFDRASCLVVTDLIYPATSLTKYHLNFGRVELPADSAVAAARLLGIFHSQGLGARKEGRLPGLVNATPIGLNIFIYLRGRADGGDEMAARYLELAKDDIESRLKPLVDRWHGMAGFTHGDARWDNFLLTHGAGPSGGLNLKLIDWELATGGDPAYDVACFLGDYARFRLATAVARGMAEPDDLERKAAFPMSQVVVPAQSFWRVYARHQRLKGEEKAEFLTRVFEYMPFVLTAMGWELTMAAGGDNVTASGRLGLQFARDWAERPAAMAGEWFGLG